MNRLHVFRPDKTLRFVFACVRFLQKAFACVMTGELTKYDNIILKKDVAPSA
jgi:L-fucose mutarotase/ribose pyranase (RbsD/FucU family)